MTAAATARLRDPRLLDVVVPVGFAALVVVELLTHMDDGYRTRTTWWSTALLLATVVALGWRRTAPGQALVAGYAFVLVPSLFVAHTIFFFGTLIPLLVLTFTATRWLPRDRVAVSLLAPALVLVVVPLHQPGFDAGDYVFWIMLGSITVGLGLAVRRLDHHRVALSTALAEQMRDQELRERALLADQRTRIARELHDVVAHAVSVMVVQAGAARLAVGNDDDEARTGMLEVENAGREALVDLRRLLGLLRPEAEDDAVQPSPGLAMVGDLVARMQASGLVVDVQVSGRPTSLPAGLDLSAYRIVQEALTNVLKHAGPTQVQVALQYGDSLGIDVIDAGPAPDHQRHGGVPGHGVVGMRERATVFGGSCTAGPYGRGWRVSAVLPLPSNAPPDLATVAG